MSYYNSPAWTDLKDFWMEPDIFEETYHGLKAVGRRNQMKAWCGYVGVTEGHPLFGKGYNDRIPVSDRGAIQLPDSPIAVLCEAMHEDDGCVSLDVLFDVHGGITYAGHNWPCADGLWYFGFDCCHYNDLTPQQSVSSLVGGYRGEGTYRNISYVKEQCKILAAALKEFAS